MTEKTYGIKVKITNELLSHLLFIKGRVVHVQSDPISSCFEFFITGDEGHFPEVIEGCQCSTGVMIASSKDNVIISTEIEDVTTGIVYPHFRREESIEDEGLL